MEEEFSIDNKVKEIVILTWEDYGFPEWDLITTPEKADKLLNWLYRVGYRQPETYYFSIDLLKILAYFLGRLGLWGADPEYINKTLEKVVIK